MPSERRLHPVCRIPSAFKTAVEINAIFQYGRFDWSEMMRRPPYQKSGGGFGKVCPALPKPPVSIMICLSVFDLNRNRFLCLFPDSATAGTPLPLTLPHRAVFFSAVVFDFPFPAAPAGLADADNLTFRRLPLSPAIRTKSIFPSSKSARATRTATLSPY
ncbi:Uncharacterised protein [Neisseria gonorrhoeae]|uniref:Uncharacterized protein n=1 Tax=Neisseria gonorrhoeae TaxID=485 RepID=A0A378VWR7_NEIGO|nr:Uncharacterised protein [Neisseria gonorrhoeae]